MKRTERFQPHDTTLTRRDDGALIYRSNKALGTPVDRTGDWLHQWADEAPERVFLAERSGAGWREMSYGAALEQVRSIAASLLARGMNGDTPILILSGNGVDHGLLALAAQYAGIPAVPVAEQYSLIHGAHGRLRHAIELTRPKMAYAVDADQYGEALALEAFEGIEVVASEPGSNDKVTPFDDLLKGDAGVDLDVTRDAVGPDDTVKILLTSGSTSSPKGVITTHRMMCVNQLQILDSLPQLKDRVPRIVDWLPWNHVFGGSHNFNMMLANGGALYIDDGKPVKGLFERTLENLSMVTGTLSFNVPVGYGLLVEALRADAGLKQRFFEDLDLVFYAGASLPQDIWEALEAMALDIKGEVPLMTSSWGLTETAPAAMFQQEPTDSAGVIGVPMTGLEMKLIPDEEMRCEVRLKGPSITPGYLDNPEKTAEAFDGEGFFITGDAMKFVDPNDPNMGMKFDGRIAEDFKLNTGTWVRAAQLRIDLLALLSPLAADLVVTGADRHQIGLMIFPNLTDLQVQGFGIESDNGAMTDKLLLGEIRRRLAERAREVSGSSVHVGRAMVLSEPADMGAGEMTAKGNLNYRKVLDRRKALLERLYDDGDAAVTTV
ncbi:feruloyl-CoA synthase [Alisedimentitalea sp. MJ-SS2]|uniref:feruloyl-CoA synthase n=1 Tax=Aliisedimentitalea sp. MJ-SS2 TaxID=3049795 RepID=UPI002911F34F|nr:feruloyl-CoA synthase [Alisedimentitalea sp. MJ-SS2]MDU8925798.1 feruloyl-CoA synthase [Alisedimentitalea sp. MJ-SS2]